MTWKCWLLKETNLASLSLRRYGGMTPCPGNPYGMSCHDSRAYIGSVPITITPMGGWDVNVPAPPQGDPRWPIRCQCGYVFVEDDTWQLESNRYYLIESYGKGIVIEGVNPGGVQRAITLREATPGMMWNAPWYAAREDGLSMVVRLPGGEDWAIDEPSSSGGPGWKRKGVPPLLTVTPSISTSRYHGFLTDGYLTDDLEGRTYEPAEHE